VQQASLAQGHIITPQRRTDAFESLVTIGGTISIVVVGVIVIFTVVIAVAADVDIFSILVRSSGGLARNTSRR
jgi:hypothetical protein